MDCLGCVWANSPQKITHQVNICPSFQNHDPYFALLWTYYTPAYYQIHITHPRQSILQCFATAIYSNHHTINLLFQTKKTLNPCKESLKEQKNCKQSQVHVTQRSILNDLPCLPQACQADFPGYHVLHATRNF